MNGINRTGRADDHYTHRKGCRVCGNEKTLHKFLSLGPTPLANSFLTKEQLDETELSYPLDVYFCGNCNLVQLLDVVSPEVMFRDYVYMTGASKPMEAHFTELAGDVIRNLKIGKNSMVMDIGSNDGTLLQGFSRYGMRTLGIEPASNIARLAESRGIQTVNAFFNEDTAIKIRSEHGHADIITGTNVFAHIDNLDSILRGINHLLSDKGFFIVEVPYLPNLLNNLEFDTIYHEHLSYFALVPLVHLFRKFNMEIIDVRSTPIHGGTIRVFVQKGRAKASGNVVRLLDKEKEAKLDSLETYVKFANRVTSLREKLLGLLKTLKSSGAKITGYGATAKGNTLLNFCGIGTDIIDYISDTTPLKQGRYSPGMHIPVVSDAEFHERPPDYALLLAWNYADDILKKETAYRKNGGKFIIPIPEPEVI